MCVFEFVAVDFIEKLLQTLFSLHFHFCLILFLLYLWCFMCVTIYLKDQVLSFHFACYIYDFILVK